MKSQITKQQRSLGPDTRKSRLFSGSGLLAVCVVAIAVLATLPFWGIIWKAFGDSSDVWPHLISYVLPQSALNHFVGFTWRWHFGFHIWYNNCLVGQPF